MDKVVILIMGKSGCGKSTLEHNLISTWPRHFKKVVSSTTRPKRTGEKNGIDYWFITDDQCTKTDFIQQTEFAGHRYGSSVEEYLTKHPYPILCVVPSSAREFTKTLAERFPTWGTYNIYFDISDQRLIANMRARGDTEQMITKRILQDTLDKQFEQSGLKAHFVVNDSLLNENLHRNVFQDIVLYKMRHEIYNAAKINWNSPERKINNDVDLSK